MWKGIMAVVVALTLATPCAAQQRQAAAFANYANTMHSHQNSWGAGAQYQLTWGGEQAPARLGTSLGGDYQRQESGGQSQASVSYDMTAQFGGSSTFTPYAGGSIGANWLSGAGAPKGVHLGLQYILGAQFKLEPQSPVSLCVEVRPGYVKTQEHSTTGRVGVAFSM